MVLLGDVVVLVLLLVGVLVGVAFLTLFERSVLGFIQSRKGPNVVGWGGLLQPFADAMKLLLKGKAQGLYFNGVLYLVAPLLGMAFGLMMWLVIPFCGNNGWDFLLGLLFFFVCSSFGVYGVMMAGWSANSSYGMLGAYRSVAQTISYEVSMIMILLVVVMLKATYDTMEFEEEDYFVFGGWLALFIMWVVTCVAELNRTPFDFAEGESELVSGFNVEYSGGFFAVIFITEYANILLMSVISVIFFFGVGKLIFSVMLVGFMILWLRGVLARFRYDSMMMLLWKSLLPFVMMILVYGVGFVGVCWF